MLSILLFIFALVVESQNIIYNTRNISIIDVKDEILFRRTYNFLSLNLILPPSIKIQGSWNGLTRLICKDRKENGNEIPLLFESHSPSLYEEDLLQGNDIVEKEVPKHIIHFEGGREEFDVHPLHRMMYSLLDESYHLSNTHTFLLLLNSHFENETMNIGEGLFPAALHTHKVTHVEINNLLSDISDCTFKILHPDEVNVDGSGFIYQQNEMDIKYYTESFTLKQSFQYEKNQRELNLDKDLELHKTMKSWLDIYIPDYKVEHVDECFNFNTSLIETHAHSQTNTRVTGIDTILKPMLSAIMDPLTDIVSATIGAGLISAMSDKVAPSMDNEVTSKLSNKVTAGVTASLKTILVPLLIKSISESVSDTFSISLRDYMLPLVTDNITSILTQSLTASLVSTLPVSLGDKLAKNFTSGMGMQLSSVLTREMSASEEEKEVKEDGSITIRVKDVTGEEVFFKVKPVTQMSKIFDAYAKRRGVATNALRFLLDGKRIEPTDTPKQLELDEGDQIDCLLEQVGGN